MSKKNKSGKGLFLLGALAVLGVTGYGLGPGQWFESQGESQVEGVPVRRGPLRISVVERANLKAKDAASLKSELEGRATILSLVDEGTYVTAGTLVAELDASVLIDSRVSQDINVQNAEAAFTKARENYEIQALQNTSDIAAAEQALDFARSDEVKYLEGDWPQQLQEADEAIVLAEEETKRAEDRLKWSQELEEKGFLTRTELEGDQLAFDRNKILKDQAVRRKELLIQFDHPKETVRLRAAVEEAERELERTKLQAKAKLVDFESDKRTAKARFDLESEQLAKLKDQIDKARLYAPVDGMVVYGREKGGRWGGGDPISEGTEVRERQEIISIPTAAGMIAEASIHESVLKQVETGQRVNIQVDALPGVQLVGEVSFVALLPDKNSWWANPDLRVYRAEITLLTSHEEMRPGMSCSLEILVEDIPNATYAPVQSVLPHKGETICFVSKGGVIETRTVKVGRSNDLWVEVLDGLQEGEIVLLSPPEGFEPEVGRGDSVPADFGDAPGGTKKAGERRGGKRGKPSGEEGSGKKDGSASEWGGSSNGPASKESSGAAEKTLRKNDDAPGKPAK